MVCDSLHIICGNCGAYLSKENSDIAKASIEKNYGEPTDVTITCENCSTVHSLNQYMEILE